MGNFIRLNKWLNKPTWGDFIVLMVGWAVLFGAGVLWVISSAECRSILMSVVIILMLLTVYVIMFYSGYNHVKKHKKKVYNKDTM